MFLHYCEECNLIQINIDKTRRFRCSKCGKNMIPLECTADEWNSFTQDEMRDVVDRACEKYADNLPEKEKVEIKKPDFSEKSETKVEETVIEPTPEPEQSEILHSNEQEEKIEKTKTQELNEGRTIRFKEDSRAKHKTLFGFAVAFYILAVIMLGKGIDKMTNYTNSEYSWSTNHNAYVGGDAYNYIINGNYATGFFTLATGFMITGTLLLGTGMIISRMPESMKIENS